MKRNISLLLFATAAWLFVGCNNFLDKSPDSELNVDIDSEEKIAELEDKIASIDAECAKPEVAVNSAKLGELTKQQSEYQEELEKQYEVWEELSMELDA